MKNCCLIINLVHRCKLKSGYFVSFFKEVDLMRKLNKRSKELIDTAEKMVNSNCACKAYKCFCNGDLANEYGYWRLGAQVRMTATGYESMSDMK